MILIYFVFENASVASKTALMLFSLSGELNG
jgi:hypothetical protein